MDDTAPQLVLDELPCELERMEAAMAAAKKERDSEIREVDIDFQDAMPLPPLSFPVQMPLSFDMDPLTQGIAMYNIYTEYRVDRDGRHFWQFDDRRQIPLLVVVFKSAASGTWLATVNDEMMPLSAFLSITYAGAAAAGGGQQGHGQPMFTSVVCKTSGSELFRIPNTTVAHIMKALGTITQPQESAPPQQQGGPGPHPECCPSL